MLHDYDAAAHLKGSAAYPDISGIVGFKAVRNGTWVDVQVTGLPEYRPGNGEQSQTGPHGFHIHNGTACGDPDSQDPFADADGHWNPTGQPHGNHSGDFPVLFSNHGKASMLFFTDRFQPSEVFGKTVVIHLSPDDYRTQPAGNSGEKIACGVIAPAPQPRQD